MLKVGFGHYGRVAWAKQDGSGWIHTGSFLLEPWQIFALSFLGEAERFTPVGGIQMVCGSSGKPLRPVFYPSFPYHVQALFAVPWSLVTITVGSGCGELRPIIIKENRIIRNDTHAGVIITKIFSGTLRKLMDRIGESWTQSCSTYSHRPSF